MARKAYTIRENGQVTLPIEFRKKYGLKKGDVVFIKETPDGLVINAREAQVMNALDEIDEALRSKGITLDELLESSQELREEIAREKYGQDTVTKE
jgi:AbrB family looped-hinge helix DNA binding protein